MNFCKRRRERELKTVKLTKKVGNCKVMKYKKEKKTGMTTQRWRRGVGGVCSRKSFTFAEPLIHLFFCN